MGDSMISLSRRLLLLLLLVFSCCGGSESREYVFEFETSMESWQSYRHAWHWSDRVSLLPNSLPSSGGNGFAIMNDQHGSDELYTPSFSVPKGGSFTMRFFIKSRWIGSNNLKVQMVQGGDIIGTLVDLSHHASPASSSWVTISEDIPPHQSDLSLAVFCYNGEAAPANEMMNGCAVDQIIVDVFGEETVAPSTTTTPKPITTEKLTTKFVTESSTTQSTKQPTTKLSTHSPIPTEPLTISTTVKTPTEVPTKLPTESSTGPLSTTAKTPTEDPTKLPTVSSSGPLSTTAKTPTEDPTKLPTDSSTRPLSTTAKTPTEDPTKLPTDSSTRPLSTTANTPTEDPTKLPTDSSTRPLSTTAKTPTEDPTKLPTETSTGPLSTTAKTPTEDPTKLPTDPSRSTTAKMQTEASSEKPTEAPQGPLTYDFATGTQGWTLANMNGAFWQRTLFNSSDLTISDPPFGPWVLQVFAKDIFASTVVAQSPQLLATEETLRVRVTFWMDGSKSLPSKLKVRRRQSFSSYDASPILNLDPYGDQENHYWITYTGYLHDIQLGEVFSLVLEGSLSGYVNNSVVIDRIQLEGVKEAILESSEFFSFENSLLGWTQGNMDGGRWVLQNWSSLDPLLQVPPPAEGNFFLMAERFDIHSGVTALESPLYQVFPGQRKKVQVKFWTRGSVVYPASLRIRKKSMNGNYDDLPFLDLTPYGDIDHPDWISLDREYYIPVEYTDNIFQLVLEADLGGGEENMIAVDDLRIITENTSI